MITALRSWHRERGRRRETGDPFAECDAQGGRERPAFVPAEWVHDATALKGQIAPKGPTTRSAAVVYDCSGRGRPWPRREPGQGGHGLPEMSPRRLGPGGRRAVL